MPTDVDDYALRIASTNTLDALIGVWQEFLEQPRPPLSEFLVIAGIYRRWRDTLWNNERRARGEIL